MKSKNFKKKYVFKGLGVIRFLEKTRNWELDAGLKFSATKKHREYFQTLELAKSRAQELLIKLKNEGLNGFKLSPSEQLDAINAYEIISGLHVNLVQVAKFYSKSQTLRGSSMSMTDLMQDRLNFLSDEKARGDGLSERSISDYSSKYKILSGEIGDIILTEFCHIEHWEPLSRKFGNSSRRYENHLRILFNYAVGRDYITSSPMKGKLSPLPKLSKPKILSEAQWRSLFITAIETEEKYGLLAYVLLTTVMGLRPESEVRNISWDDINLSARCVFIGDDQTGKNQLGRTLEIPEFAIKLFLRCKRQQGPIIPSVRMFNKNWEKLRILAGFITKDENGKTIQSDWSPDVARHTAATMHYGFFKSKERVSAFLGHTNNATMRYYINHSKGIGEEAKRFYSFSIDDTRNEELR